jgi:uncharacterized protein with von Willebrand factor type A (vWA) domain
MLQKDNLLVLLTVWLKHIKLMALEAYIVALLFQFQVFLSIEVCTLEYTIMQEMLFYKKMLTLQLNFYMLKEQS